MTAKQKVYALAAKNGCEIIVWPGTKLIELHAPDGKVFSGLDSHAVNFGGSAFGQDPINWTGALSFFTAEIKEGFDNE